MKRIFLMMMLAALLAACGGNSDKATAQIESPSVEQLNSYWRAGEAELVSYTLQQVRYGAVHEGKEDYAVHIYVTEDFLLESQVKFERPSDEPKATVLKINNIREFLTGMYEYNFMTSVFTPYESIGDGAGPRDSIKVTFTGQDWCGHVFAQLNHRGNNYEGELRSYFQSEGDEDFTVDNVVLEDELWTILRLDPNELPRGEFEILPSMTFLRFHHLPMETTNATATLELQEKSDYSNEAHLKYEVIYPEFDNRRKTIWFEREFPFKILGWEETGIGREKGLVTKAKRKEIVKTDYWSKNQPGDENWYKKLGSDS